MLLLRPLHSRTTPWPGNNHFPVLSLNSVNPLCEWVGPARSPNNCTILSLTTPCIHEEIISKRTFWTCLYILNTSYTITRSPLSSVIRVSSGLDRYVLDPARRQGRRFESDGGYFFKFSLTQVSFEKTPLSEPT